MHCRRNGAANFDMLQKRGGAKGGGCNNLVHCKMRQSHNLTGRLVNLSVSQCIPARVTTTVLQQAISPTPCTGLGVQLKNAVYQELMRCRIAK